MYKARKRKGTLKDPDAPVKFVAFGGDGSTYDIGFQWLSGAMERGHDFTYICLDYENYGQITWVGSRRKGFQGLTSLGLGGFHQPFLLGSNGLGVRPTFHYWVKGKARKGKERDLR